MLGPAAKSGLFPDPVRSRRERARSGVRPRPLAEGPGLVLVAAGRHRAPAPRAVLRMVVEGPAAVRVRRTPSGRCQVPSAAERATMASSRASPASMPPPPASGPARSPAKLARSDACRQPRSSAATASGSRSPPLWVSSTARRPSRTSSARLRSASVTSRAGLASPALASQATQRLRGRSARRPRSSSSSTVFTNCWTSAEGSGARLSRLLIVALGQSLSLIERIRNRN